MELLVETLALLHKRNETLSVAESCTGGGLANAITCMPGVSPIFMGSITAYANRIKETLLFISPVQLARHGAVSEEVALSMASNCRGVFTSTWALSTTGIAGPSGGSEQKPVGLVYIGLAGPKNIYAKRFIFAPCTRLMHREKTIAEALTMLHGELLREV